MRWWIANKARSAQLAIIISYPTGVSWIIVLLKTPRKISRSLICKNNRFSTCFCLWANVYGCHIWRAWYNGSYAIMAKPIRALELHYPMIQFLIINISGRTLNCDHYSKETFLANGGCRPWDKGGPGYPDQRKGGTASKKNFFRPFGPQFGLKMGAAGSATASYTYSIH